MYHNDLIYTTEEIKGHSLMLTFAKSIYKTVFTTKSAISCCHCHRIVQVIQLCLMGKHCHRSQEGPFL